MCDGFQLLEDLMELNDRHPHKHVKLYKKMLERGTERKREMGSILTAPTLLLALFFSGILAAAAASGGQFHVDPSLTSDISIGRCNGSIADCLGEEEFEMGSESSRRILQGNPSIAQRAVQIKGKPAPSPAPSGKPYKPGCSNALRC